MFTTTVIFDNGTQLETVRNLIEQANNLLEGGISIWPALHIQADGEKQEGVIRALFPSPAQIGLELLPESQPEIEHPSQLETHPAPELDEAKRTTELCLNCGEPVEVGARGKPLMYCSITCAEEYRRKHSSVKPTCIKCGVKLRSDNKTGYCTKHAYIKNLTGVKPGRKPNTSGKAGMQQGTCSICHRDNVSITSKGECMSCIISGARNRAVEKHNRELADLPVNTNGAIGGRKVG